MRDILEQVRRVRSNKINAGLQLLVGPITVKLNNLSAMEINTIRPFFQGSLDRFYSLSQVIDEDTLKGASSLRCQAMQNLTLPCCADGRSFLSNQHAVCSRLSESTFCSASTKTASKGSNLTKEATVWSPAT